MLEWYAELEGGQIIRGPDSMQGQAGGKIIRRACLANVDEVLLKIDINGWAEVRGRRFEYLVDRAARVRSRKIVYRADVDKKRDAITHQAMMIEHVLDTPKGRKWKTAGWIYQVATENLEPIGFELPLLSYMEANAHRIF